MSPLLKGFVYIWVHVRQIIIISKIIEVVYILSKLSSTSKLEEVKLHDFCKKETTKNKNKNQKINLN